MKVPNNKELTSMAMANVLDPNAAAVLYRLSHEKDSTSAEVAAFDRQREACTRWADAHGLTVVRDYAEGIVSAHKANAHRPLMEEALEALERGDFGTLVVSSIDRLSRRGAGMIGTLLDRFEGSGRRIVFVRENLDSSVDANRLSIVALSEIARAESANASARIRAEKAQARDAGRWLGGRVPWGWTIGEDRRLYLVPELVPIMRRVVKEVTEGASVRSVAARLSSEGVPTARGGASWRTSTLVNWLRSPVLAGWQPEDRFQVYLHPETGQPVDVAEPLISPAERARLLASLDGRAPGRPRRGRKPTSLLGGGMLRCVCGAKMALDSSRRSYVCTARASGMVAECGGNAVSQDGTDAEVVSAFVRRLSSLATDDPTDPFVQEVARRWLGTHDPALLEERAHLVAEVEDLTARLTALDEAHWTRGSFGDPTTPEATTRWEAAARPLRERLEAATADRDAVALPEPDLGFLMDALLVREAMETAPLDDRRALLALAIDRVTVTKATRQRGVFDPSRVSVTAWAS